MLTMLIAANASKEEIAPVALSLTRASRPHLVFSFSRFSSLPASVNYFGSHMLISIAYMEFDGRPSTIERQQANGTGQRTIRLATGQRGYGQIRG